MFVPGIVNTSFPLSDQPVLGTWLIFVDVQGQIYNKTFTVDEYGEMLLSLLCWDFSKNKNSELILNLYMK